MTWLWPQMLISLGLVPILIAIYVIAQRRRRSYAVRFTNLALLSTVVGKGPGIRRHIPPLLYLLSLIALLVSLARPVVVIPVPREEAAVLIVMDVSGSMEARDLLPNRLAAAKQAARALVESLPDDVRVGLFTFSSSAMLNTPLTREHEHVLEAIDSLRAGGGTALGDGLNLAVTQFLQSSNQQNTQPGPAAVVLLSDGQPTAGIPPAIAGERAREAQIKVYTVGIGQRGARPLVGGRQLVILDEATLQELAEQTGGEYYYAPDASELERIYADLGSQVGWDQERTEVTALVSALGTVLLVIGGLLSLRWLQRLP